MEDKNISRRTLLGVASVGLSASTAGCVTSLKRMSNGYDTLTVEFKDETNCFKSIGFEDVGHISSMNLTVSLSSDYEPDYIVLYADGRQRAVESVYTGEWKVSLGFNQDEPEIYEKIAAVSGGEKGFSKHSGGTVIEEARIRAWFDE